MPQYTTGLARALSAAPQRIELVGGTTTNQIVPGDLFRFQADAAPAWFMVSSILSSEIFELTGPYNGAQAFDTLLPYLITRDFTPNFFIPELAPGDIAIREVYTMAMRIIDALLGRAASGEFSFVGPITTGDKPFRWYSPMRARIRSVHVCCGTPPSGIPLLVDIKLNGVSILSTPISLGVAQFAVEQAISVQMLTNDFLTVNIVQGSGSDLVVQVRF